MERYVLASTTGYLGMDGRAPTTEWMVLDSARSYELVYSSWQTHKFTPKERAQALADYLNAGGQLPAYRQRVSDLAQELLRDRSPLA